MKILMICLGNICRSPLAEGILAAKLAARGLSDWSVDSAGTGNWHVGSAPDRRSIEVARLHGVDISEQRCRQLTAQDFTEFDRIVGMDEDNCKEILRLAPAHLRAEAKSKIELIRDYVQPNAALEVPDPYYGTMSDFELVYQLLDEASEAMLDKIAPQKLT